MNVKIGFHDTAHTLP